jgi:dipeptidyl aminopeptidase/acylaminoacyl peptidase
MINVKGILATGLLCATLGISQAYTSHELEWKPSVLMNLKAIKDVQLSPNNKTTVFTTTEALMNEENKYFSKIYKMENNEKEPKLLSSPSVSCSQPRWSPDGKWVAYLYENHNATKELHLIDIKTNKDQAVVFGGAFDVQNFKWSPDSQQLLFVKSEEINQQISPYLVDQPKTINRLWLLHINQPNQPISLTNDLYHVRGNADFGIIHEDYDWSPDGKKIVFAYSPNKGFDSFYRDSALALVDLETMNVVPIKNHLQHESMPRYSPDGKWISYLGSPKQSNYKLDRDVWVRSVSSDKNYQLASTHNNGVSLLGITLLGWTADSSGVYLTEPKETRTALFILPVDGAPSKEVNLRNLFFKDAALSFDHQHLGFVVQSSDTPPEAYVYDLKRNESIQLTQLNKEFLALPKTRTEKIEWKSKDGIMIEGLLTYPINYQKNTLYPLLLVIHGGPMGVFDETFIGSPAVYPLASFSEMGFFVLRPNPRGSTGYGTYFRSLNQKDWGGEDLEDLLTGVDYLIKKNLVNPSKLGVMGWSYGGYMTGWAVTQTKRFKAASMGAGLYNLVSVSGTADLETLFPDYLGNLVDNLELYHNRSPLFYAQNVQTPCLIQHGAADKRAPSSQSQEFYRALKLHNKEVQFFLYPEMGHRFTQPKLQLDLLEKNLDWFKNHVL